jgi:hypothetical protein
MTIAEQIDAILDLAGADENLCIAVTAVHIFF